jgi:ribosome-associated protein
MDIRKLQRAIVDGLEDVKAQAIEVYNTEALSPLFERVIIATGASNRQTKALAASVRDAVRSRGLPVMRTEGEENGEWIIVDCGPAVVHIMQPAIREYYHLEEIWGGKPVRMKLGAPTGRGLVKASEDAADAAVPMAAPTVKAAPKTVAKAAPKKRATARRPATPRQPPAKGGVRTIVVGQPGRKSAAKSGTQPAAKRGGRGTVSAKRGAASATRRRA